MKPNGSPRRKLYCGRGSVSSGAGGDTSATISVPFGRKWRLVSAWVLVDEASKGLGIYHRHSTTIYDWIAYDGSSTSSTPIQYKSANLNSSAQLQDRGTQDVWLSSADNLYFLGGSLSASKTVTYGYVYEEYADDGKTAEPT